MTTDNNFSPIEFFRKEDGQYRFLPFRFKRLGNQVFLSNLIGDSLILDKEEFADFTKKRLSKVSPKYAILRARHFLADDNKTHEDLLSSELWTKKILYSRIYQAAHFCFNCSMQFRLCLLSSV